jgi:hypothetical protein
MFPEDLCSQTEALLRGGGIFRREDLVKGREILASQTLLFFSLCFQAAIR